MELTEREEDLPDWLEPEQPKEEHAAPHEPESAMEVPEVSDEPLTDQHLVDVAALDADLDACGIPAVAVVSGFRRGNRSADAPKLDVH